MLRLSHSLYGEKVERGDEKRGNIKEKARRNICNVA